MAKEKFKFIHVCSHFSFFLFTVRMYELVKLLAAMKTLKFYMSDSRSCSQSASQQRHPIW